MNSLVRLRRSVGLRLLIAVLLFSSCVTLVLTGLQLYFDYRVDMSAIEVKLGEIEQGYLNSIGESLWQLDQVQLELELKGIRSLPDIAYVEVAETGNGKTPLTVTAGEPSAGPVLRRELPIVHQSGGIDRRIGRLVIEANLDPVYRRLAQKGLVILASQAAKTFLVSSFIVFIFYRLVGRHLSTIARDVSAYDIQAAGPPIRLQRQPPAEPDELDRVVGAFSELGAKLHAAYVDLRRSNRRLEQDILRRIAAEEALRTSEERFQDYALAASDWFWETGPDHRFTYLSARIRTHGVDPDALLGQLRWEMAADRESEPQKWQDHLAILERHEPFHGLTYRMERPEGESVFLESNGRPVFDRAGNFMGYRGTGRDVTEAVLAQRALSEARDEAEAASRAKSRFLANMSHELRTPLNAIIGLAEMIGGQILGPVGNGRYLEYAGDIRASGAHLLGIVNEVLDIAKIEAGRYELDEQALDPVALATEVLRILGIEADRAGLSLEAAIEPGLPMILADAQAIRRILFNLLSNALKFTPHGGRVLLTMRRLPESVEIAVKDTGIGISSVDIPKLMQPFAQVEGAYQRRYPGTGLGLAIVRALADLHGGNIEMESTPGQGTIVRLLLPAERLVLR
ncbi:MAG TPA: ATP-binding protein [Candidatus Cybelea sp.]|nr:ATP-binding protein [Candidatus Cybelea sp.]